ncbi:hypothetical protein RUM44_009773 [Polyplax serrata]|uniref:Hamartin n=1 Tax=Polyplax serrata TaxID=468196 RepID=A0ABR1ATR1_POLSC
MDPPEVLKLLESNHPEKVEEAKNIFHEHFNDTKESWLLNGLVDYFISTGSMRCVDILVGVREPHDKYFFDRVFDSLKNTPAVRLSVLTLLGHVVFRQPTWLYKISQHSLLKEVLRILKTETDILILISALLTLIVLLPTIPANIGPFLHEIFEVFSRLASWNTNNPNKLPEPQLIHLQVSLQSLFHRLYGMYPCNFLSYLRNEYSLRENLGVFSHTIKPMLDTVKMHPLLVTASKDTETTTSRWKTMEHHDVVVECAKLSVFTKDEVSMPYFAVNRPRDSDLKRFIGTQNVFECTMYQENVTLQSTGDVKEFWSPSIHCGASTPPLQTLDSSIPTSIPHTPITQNYVISSFPSQEGTSPPEAAIEATPETTPVKDSRLYAPRGPPLNSTAVRPLNLSGGRPKGSTTSTPSQSQPSSPMKKEMSPFRFPDGCEGGHEMPFFERRKESIITLKVSSLIQDNLNVAAAAAAEAGGTTSGGEKTSRGVGKNVFDSVSLYSRDGSNGFKVDDCTSEDQEVLEISRLGEQLKVDSATSSTSVGVPLRHCDSVIQDFHPPHGEDIEDCQQDIGSPCNSGGLHMPNSRSMLNFHQSVHRLRYFSQCGPESPANQVEDATRQNSNSQESILLPSNYVRRAQSCPEMEKDRPSFSGGEDLDESVENDYEKKITNGEGGEKIIAHSSTQTQWTELCTQSQYPYEHLFLGIFPSVEQQPNAAAMGAHRYSPTTFLDRYIELSAGLSREESQSKRSSNITVQSLENELKTARDQLSLLHLQLKFERQRREVHAERNRRLLGKSRHNRWLEDHNSALRDQLALLGKDVECITKDLEKNKAESRQNESRLQERIKHWQDKYAISENQNRELKSENERLVFELSQSKAAAVTTAKEFQQVEGMLFSLGNELKEATAQASAGEQLKSQVEYLQKELILMGELLQKYREKISHFTLQSDEKNSILHEYYVEEVRNLNGLVDLKTSALEAGKNRINELEVLLAKKDSLIADQKRALKTVKEECQEQLEAVETKYKSQISINRKLEECIFELTSKLETAAKRNRRGISAAQDVLSLAERGGLNSPLSLSLSSSEGLSMSCLLTAEIPSRDLQSIVDEPEVSQVPEADDRENQATGP